MDAAAPLFAFVAGAVFGSFLNVCIYRLPKEESVVWPGSRCRDCRRPIAWFDNIPVVSYVALGGRCRQCLAKISLQYPLVELLTASLFVIFYLWFGLTAAGVIYLFFSMALLVESLIDWRHQIIPDAITLPGIVIGIAASAVFPALHREAVWWKGLASSTAGMLLGGGILYVVAVFAEKIMKKEAMGGGDVKLLAMIGALTGWQGALWTLMVSSFLGSIVGIWLRLTKGQERIPYGPYLALGAFLYLFFGETSIAWYFDSLNRMVF